MTDVMQLYKNKNLDKRILKNINYFSYYRLFFETLAFYAIVTLLLRAKGMSFTQIMMLSSIENIFTTALEVPTGVVADKFGRKASVMSGVAFFILFIISYIVFNSFIALVFCGLLFALSSTMISGANSAMIYDYLKYEKLEDIYVDFSGKVSSKVMIAKSMVTVVSTYLFDINNNIPLVLSIVSCIIALAFLSKFVEAPMIEDNVEHKEVVEDSSEKKRFDFLKSIRLNKNLRSLLAVRLVVIIVISNAFYLTELLLSDMGMDISKIGIVIFCYTLVSAFGSRSASKINDKFGDKIFFVMFVLFGVSLLFSSMNDIVIIIISIGVLRFVNSAMSPIFNSIANRNIDSQERATILSIVSLFLSFGMAITDPIVGVVADMYSLSTVYRILGIICMISSVVAYKFYRKRIKN